MGRRVDRREDDGLSLAYAGAGQFEFVEWTPDGHLRHARFVGLRKDKAAPRREAVKGGPQHRLRFGSTIGSQGHRVEPASV
jgi:hypothetical protein